jgi:hypothetical protein
MSPAGRRIAHCLKTLAKTDVYALKAPHACGAFTYRLLRDTADFTKGYWADV